MKSVFKTLKNIGGLDSGKRHDIFESILKVCQADAQGRTGKDDMPYPQRQFWLDAGQAARNIRYTDEYHAMVQQQGQQNGQNEQNDPKNKLSGEAFGQALRLLQIRALKTWHRSLSKTDPIDGYSKFVCDDDHMDEDTESAPQGMQR